MKKVILYIYIFLSITTNTNSEMSHSTSKIQFHTIQPRDEIVIIKFLGIILYQTQDQDLGISQDLLANVPAP